MLDPPVPALAGVFIWLGPKRNKIPLQLTYYCALLETEASETPRLWARQTFGAPLFGVFGLWLDLEFRA